MGGRYHGNYRKERAHLNGFSGIDPPQVPAKIKNTCHSWIEAVAQVEILIDEHKERIEQLRRMRKAFESAQKAGASYPN